MCGIAGIHRRGKQPIRMAGRLADNLLREIEKRGTHATGLAVITAKGELHVEKATLPARKFVMRRKAFSPLAKSVLLHTRFATVGAKEDPVNAHPQTAGSCTAIHNGTIYNADEVFAAFGLERKAQVDSEVIPAIVAHAGWAQANDGLGLLRGGAAVAIISTEVPDEVILARLRNYPLEILVTKEVVVWASTRAAISIAWQRTYGRAPRGRWLNLEDYSMIRVNGSVGKPVAIDRAPEPPKPPLAGTPVSRRARKAARKAARVASSAPPRPAWAYDPSDLFTAYERLAIDDLMAAGYSRATAETLVLDWEEPEDDDNPWGWNTSD